MRTFKVGEEIRVDLTGFDINKPIDNCNLDPRMLQHNKKVFTISSKSVGMGKYLRYSLKGISGYVWVPHWLKPLKPIINQMEL